MPEFDSQLTVNACYEVVIAAFVTVPRYALLYEGLETHPVGEPKQDGDRRTQGNSSHPRRCRDEDAFPRILVFRVSRGCIGGGSIGIR